MSISRVGNSNTVPIAGVSTSIHKPAISERYYKFNEQFDFSKLKLSEQISEANDDTAKLHEILYLLMHETLASGCDIHSRSILADHNTNTMIEASFEPPNFNKPPAILVPLANTNLILEAKRYNSPQLRKLTDKELKEALADVVKESNNQRLLKLIILLSHEYGHYQSYQRGYHDQELKFGLQLMHTKVLGPDSDKYVYHVFSEEVTAWRFAKQVLKRHQFEHWTSFDQVKYHSLKTYYKLSNLAQASLAIYTKLSMLDINLELLI